MYEHERSSDYWQNKHRALENAVYNSEHDIVSCVQCGCKIIAPLLADSPRCKDCREGIVQPDCECERLRAQLAAAVSALLAIAGDSPNQVQSLSTVRLIASQALAAIAAGGGR